MSHYVRFKLDEAGLEMLKEKDPVSYYKMNEVSLREQEITQELLVACMKKGPINENVRTALFYYRSISDVLKSYILKRAIHDALQRHSKDGEIWYCGRDKESPLEWDIETLQKEFVEKLIMYTFMIDTKDYYNPDERQYFYDKLDQVKNAIDDYIEELDTWAIFEIIGWLQEYKVKTEENGN
jgi:hypothetical protein